MELERNTITVHVFFFFFCFFQAVEIHYCAVWLCVQSFLPLLSLIAKRDKYLNGRMNALFLVVINVSQITLLISVFVSSADSRAICSFRVTQQNIT